jgi:hypothetical protein
VALALLFTVPAPASEPIGTFFPFTDRVVPVGSESAEFVPNAAELPAIKVPDTTTVGPEYVFAPLNVRLPPLTESPPVPEMASESVNEPAEAYAKVLLSEIGPEPMPLVPNCMIPALIVVPPE